MSHLNSISETFRRHYWLPTQHHTLLTNKISVPNNERYTRTKALDLPLKICLFYDLCIDFRRFVQRFGKIVALLDHCLKKAQTATFTGLMALNSRPWTRWKPNLSLRLSLHFFIQRNTWRSTRTHAMSTFAVYYCRNCKANKTNQSGTGASILHKLKSDTTQPDSNFLR